MKFFVSEKYKTLEPEIIKLIQNFENEGAVLIPHARNSIKIFTINGLKLNIKSFRLPNAFNKVAYRFFRKSKAERSFFFAKYLLKKGIGTPEPYAYAEEISTLQFKRSYYVSEHLDYDLSFREIDLSRNGHEEILRAFTRFTFKLHENNVEFLDHSPGNTLIQKCEEGYEFFLVDLNRMVIKELNFVERMKNFSRLTPKKEMVEVMASEYSKLINKPEAEVFGKMWFFTHQFQKRFMRKHRWKKKLGIKK